MALKRRDFMLALPVLCGAAACAGASRERALGVGYHEISSIGAASGVRVIVVFMPETKQTQEVWTGLSDELGKEFRLVAVKIESADEVSSIAHAIRTHQPAGIVLMNNPTVVAYGRYQRASGLAQHPPAVVVMSSFLDRRPAGISNATGISYEVPLITVVTNLRKLVETPVERIGVVRREPLHGFVERQAALARREQITVVEASVSGDPNASELKRAIRDLKQRCDAIWVLNDDHLLTERLIADGWLPGLNERPWVPAIVGAASLVSSEQSFGTFAVLPDHTALGTQTANLLFDIAADDWTLSSDDDVQLPLSVTTSADLVQARERFALQKDALEHVDHILE